MGSSLVFLASLTMAIGAGVAFWTAVNAFMNGLGAIVATSLIGDIIEVLSIFLPFSLAQLIGLLAVVFNSIISFWIAQKVFNMLMSLLGGAVKL